MKLLLALLGFLSSLLDEPYKSELDFWRDSGVGIDQKERARVAKLYGLELRS